MSMNKLKNVPIEYLDKFKEVKGYQHNYSLDLKNLWDNSKKLQKSTWDYRDEYVKKYAWAVPDHQALGVISQYSPLIEIGAGTGYWGYLLNRLGVDILCFDKEPHHNHYSDHQWFIVKEGTPEILSNYPDRNLFLCWPPYDDRMAYECLKNFKGKYFIYIGEGEGGCNGTTLFFKRLYRTFKELRFIPIPHWYGLHDGLSIHKRR